MVLLEKAGAPVSASLFYKDISACVSVCLYKVFLHVKGTSVTMETKSV